ncbi:kinase-like domain-containing protein [Catenaria anguillulae PL171]|uniref:Kinase-like domain-containing protein n=1 Tax=Catenaria anguillulae PL171 TaxID=765915 RepID=A0A1Y2HVG4_9FUNG|nr:kinase-like domain-containing protein [Catenaria anguillulae PL171]
MPRSHAQSTNTANQGNSDPADGGQGGTQVPLLPTAPIDPLPLPLTPANAVTSLWAGFGTLYRIPAQASLPTSKSKSKSNATQIVKHIHMSASDLAAARSSASDLRKLHSYLAESAFYVHLAPTLPPASVPVATLDISKSSMHGDSQAADGLYTDLVLVLSDLSPAFPMDGDACAPFSPTHAQSVLAWLARFHAHFWRRSRLLEDTRYLWRPTGSYWHLATRQAELERARRARGDPWAWIVAGAEYWDLLLTKEPRWGRQTLVHGDAKAANVLFSESGDTCALVDFQYVGRGCGMRDVVYLVATSVDMARCGEYAQVIEDWYWKVLVRELAVGEHSAPPGLAECLDMFEVALLDWCRFMCGWGRWGNVKWVGKVVDAIRVKWEERRQKGWRPNDNEYST